MFQKKKNIQKSLEKSYENDAVMSAKRYRKDLRMMPKCPQNDAKENRK